MGKLKSIAELSNIIRDSERALEKATDKTEKLKLKQRIASARKQQMQMLDEDNTGTRV